jgi:Holliday junction resolvasome RuvABC endonuclease subunit
MDYVYVLGVNPASDNNLGGIGLVTVELAPDFISGQDITLTKNRTACGVISTVQDHCEPGEVYVAIEGQYVGINKDSLIKLCRGAGRWIEAACDWGYDYEIINPRTWQAKTFGNTVRKSEDIKKASCNLVKMLYNIDTKHFTADALLIARYKAINLALEADK